MALRRWLRSLRSNPTPQPARPPRLGVQQLEAREVPALALLSAVAAGSEVDNPTNTQDLAVDAAGNGYQTGYFSGTVDFDPGRTHPGDADVLTARGELDAFVVKYAPERRERRGAVSPGRRGRRRGTGPPTGRGRR